MPRRATARKPARTGRTPSSAPPGEDARRRLEAAALESFAHTGFHGTTTRDIAAEAGMSPAALYVHYKSKEETLYGISRVGHERILAIVEEAIASAEEPAAQLTAFMRTFVLHHLHRTTEARVLNYELASLSPEHLSEVAELRRRLQGHVREMLERGVEAGVFDTSNVRMSTVALLSLGIDLSRWYHPDGEWSPEEVADHYCEVALRIAGVGPAGFSPR